MSLKKTIGITGFEPVISASQMQRSSQTEPNPEEEAKASYGK